MGTTTPLGLPYPEPAGKVRAGSTAIRQLAEAVDDRIRFDDAIAQVDIAESGSGAPPGGELVSFPGFVRLMSGFTFDGSTLIYSGPTRLFMVYASVEIETPYSDSVASSLACRQNYVTTPVASTYDATILPGHTEDPTGTVRRKSTHDLCFPAQLTSGNTLQFVASSNPAGGLVGQCTFRVYPMGPKDPA